MKTTDVLVYIKAKFQWPIVKNKQTKIQFSTDSQQHTNKSTRAF